MRLTIERIQATLTFLVLLFLIPTTGPLSKTPLWNRWFQLALDAFFLVLWIAAAAVSTETCSDLCTACHYPQYDIIGWVSWEGLYCECPPDGEAIQYNPLLDKRQSPASPLVHRAVYTSTGREASAAVNSMSKATEMALKKGLDAAIV